MSNIQEIPDTTYGIFDHLFLCRIPNLLSMSPDYIRQFGTPTTGDSDIDKNMANQLITTYLPISKMVDYFKEGIPVYITTRSDVKQIYDYISAHLNGWKQRLRIGLNNSDAPIDELILLDQFANLVYSEAKYEFTKEIADSLFLRQISSISPINRSNFFKKSLEQPKATETINGVVTINGEKNPADNYPERESLEQHFKDRKAGVKSWR